MFDTLADRHTRADLRTTNSVMDMLGLKPLTTNLGWRQGDYIGRISSALINGMSSDKLLLATRKQATSPFSHFHTDILAGTYLPVEMLEVFQ